MRSAITTKTGLDFGKKLETAIFHALKRKHHHVFYWRGIKEVDFIIETENGILPIQVSWDGAKARLHEALDEFKKQYPKSLSPVIISRENAVEYL